jgi:hypothetical protein
MFNLRSDFSIRRHRFQQFDPNMQPTGGHEEFQLYGRGLSDQNGVCTVPHFRLYVYVWFDTSVLYVIKCILYPYNKRYVFLKMWEFRNFGLWNLRLHSRSLQERHIYFCFNL